LAFLCIHWAIIYLDSLYKAKIYNDINLRGMAMKKLLLSLTVASLLSVSAYSISAHEGKRHRDIEREIITSPSLTQQQKEDIKQIYKQTRQDLGIYRTEENQFRISMRAIMQSDSWDQVAVTNAIEQQMQITLQLQLIRAKSKNQVFNQLSAKQQAQFMANRDHKKGKKRNANPERKMQRLVKALDLNSDQQTQLTVMMTNDKAQRVINKEQVKNVRAQLTGIIQAEEFDDSAWLAVHAQNKQKKLDMAVSKIQSRFDLLSLLNAEQGDKFEKMMKKPKKGKGSKKRDYDSSENEYLSN
jgi:Spy/CpxP family protein refolding chaperone